MVSNFKKLYFQWCAVRISFRPAMMSYLNHTLCQHHLHDYTATKAMDIILLPTKLSLLDC